MSQYAFWTTLLLDVVIKVSLLLLVVWVGSLFMRKRSAAAQHRWWTLGFVGCLLIPAISFVTPTWTLPILPRSTQIAEPLSVDNIPMASNRAFVDPAPSGLAEHAPERGMLPRRLPIIPDQSTKAFGEQPIAASQDLADALATSSITKTLLILWIVGIAICWLRSIWQHVLLKRLLNCCVRLDNPEWNELLTKCSQSLSLRQEVSLLRHKSAHSPVSTGVWHPVVILPEDAESWDVDRRRLVLLHELSHVARRDVLTQTLAGLACGLYWFNPLCWFGLVQMRKFRELACDDLVLSCGQQPSGYADVLLGIARTYRHQSYSTAVGMAHSTNVESRIIAILDETRRHVSLSRTAARLLLASSAALVCMVGTAQLRSEVEPSARATEQGEASVEAAEETPKQDANEPIRMPIVIAEHLMLFEGREVISWDQLDEKIAALPAGSRVHPDFHFTNGAHRSGRYKQSRDKMWELHRKHHWHGHSEGSLWPSAGARYDRLKTAADLVPDEKRRLDVRVVDQEGQPVANAEVVLMPPVDESISFKEHHLTLVHGRVHNRIAYEMTLSDDEGRAALYPPPEGNYYLVALHPAGGFAITQREYVEQKPKVTLLRWAALVSKLELKQGEEQHASLSTKVPEAPGLPLLVFNQHWDRGKVEAEAELFGFTHVPPIYDTLIQRSFPNPQDGSAVSLPGATVSLLPGETRQLGLGPLSDAQRERLEDMLRRLDERRKQREIQRDKRENPANAQVTNTRSLRITIVGPDGKPVSGVGVEVRGLSDFDQSRLKIGNLVEKRRYGVSVRANDAGQLELDLAEEPPRRLGLHIEEPGYGPYWANWDSSDHPEPIPAEFKVRLERGWSVGGVVIDEEGQPIAGAKVRPSIEYKKRPGDTRQMRAGARATTVADGSWRFDCVPDSYADVTVEITHPEHSNVIASLVRGSYEVAPDAKPNKTIVVPSGLTVTGRVTDNLGQPIVDATVRTKFHNDVRTATTDKDGRYRLVGCKPKMARIVVSAPGKAMELKEVRVDPDMTPVDFVLQEGGKVRIKVVDENGVGIPKARIFFQSWRGRIDYFEFDHVNQYANNQGVWEWNEAPLDEFEADICRPGGMQLTYQKLKARDEEYVFSPPPKLAVSGKVVDAKTGAPIEKFRVVRGLRNKDSRIGIDWIEYDSYEATDGAYRVAFDHVPLAAMIRVEAVGYRVKASRDIKPDEGQVTHDFELEHEDAVVATIVTPDGKPAAEAKIALGAAGSQISITNGDIGDGQTYAKRLSSDQEGRFELPARDEAFQLVITHDTGFAYVKSSDGPIPDRIKLTPWSRVEGVFRVGTKSAPGVVLELYGDGYGPDVPNIFTHHNVTTGPDGQYVFERVFPGKGRIGRRILLMVNEGATEVTSSSRISAQFIAGKTTTLDLGGNGRPVVGKLLPPESHEGQVLWNFALVTLETDLEQPKSPTPPEEVTSDAEKRAAWWNAWKETPDGKAWAEAYKHWQAARELAPYLTASVSRDGSFRLDDTPPGDYVLTVRYDERLPGTLEQRVTVAAGTGSDDPFDLGALRLKPQNTR